MAVLFRHVISSAFFCSLLSGCSYFSATKSADEPARRVSTAPRQTAGVAHVVDKGDTLFKIAKHYTGDGDNWRNIAKANPTLNPHRLHPGQQVVIPFSVFAAAPVAYHEMQNGSRARLSPTASIETASLKTTKKQSAKKTAAKNNSSTSKRPANIAAAERKKKPKTAAAAKPPAASRPDRISDEEIGDIATELASLPAPEPIPAPIVEPKIEPKIEPKKVELAAKPAPRRPEPPTVTKAKPKVSAREPAAPRFDVEPERATRSSFYSCLADKCSLHSF